MAVLLIYNTMMESTTTIDVKDPTEQIYQSLQKLKDISSLECPCANVSILFGSFVQVNASIHEVCSSSFVEDAWIKSVFGSSDWSNLTISDFYGRGVVYFQGLRSFCFRFQENMIRYVTDFLGNALIGAKLLPRHLLTNQVDDTIEKVKTTSRGDQSSLYNSSRD